MEDHTKKPLPKVMRTYCLECCLEKPSEVRLCQSIKCPLWPYRMGKDPFRKRKMTDEQKQEAAQRLKKAKK